MGGILTFLHDLEQHWVAISICIAIGVCAWGAGYLRGYRHGEEAEMDHKYRGMIAANQANGVLRRRIDFLQADNDQLRRQNASMVKKENTPGKTDNIFKKESKQ
jgi:hypothetical protein